MSFLESYKHLEKLCGEIMQDNRAVSAYIDAMERLNGSAYYIRGWNEDLKNLKHYRWVRNQITHEPNCTEKNMCYEKDTEWLNKFYERIMNQTDPLALYRKEKMTREAAIRRAAAGSRSASPSQNTHTSETFVPCPPPIKPKRYTAAKFAAILIFLLLTAIVLLFLFNK